MTKRSESELSAAENAEDRQRLLNELCRRVLQPFYGRKVTPTLMVEAEAEMRLAIDDSIRAGNYVLPDGLELDRLELGADMRVKVFFRKTRLLKPPPCPQGWRPTPIQLTLYTQPVSAVVEGPQPVAVEISYTEYARVSVARAPGGWSVTGNTISLGAAEVKFPAKTEEPVAVRLKNRFEAVAAEINDDNEEEPT